MLTAAGATTYTYDANGNETSSSAGLSLAYNAKDQTSSLTPPGGAALAQSYTGATQIQRVAEASTSFKYGTLGLMSQTDASGTSFFTRDNTGLLVGERLPGGSRFYYLYDSLGNVVALTDSSGAVVNTYSYEPYGKMASSTGTTANPWRFGGSYGAYTENNNSGLLKIGQRFYDPSLGRWTQQDPVLHLGDPRQANRYVYVAANPINLIDPSGAAVVARCSDFSNGASVLSLGASVAAYKLAEQAKAEPPNLALITEGVADVVFVSSLLFAVGIAAGLGTGCIPDKTHPEHLRTMRTFYET